MSMEKIPQGGYRQELADKLRETRAEGGGFIKKTLGIDGKSQAEKILGKEKETDQYKNEARIKRNESFYGRFNKEKILKLLDSGEGDYLEEELSRAEDLDEEVALKFLEKGKVRAACRNLGSFHELSGKMGTTMIQEGFAGSVAKHIESFEESSHNELAKEIIENERESIDVNDSTPVDYFFRNIDKYKNLNWQEIYNGLLEKAEKFPYNKIGFDIARKLDHFEGLDHNKVAEDLININQQRAVVLYKQNFKGLLKGVMREVIEKAKMESAL